MSKINIKKNYIYIIVPILLVIIVLASFQLGQSTEEKTENHIAIVQTNVGNITLELFEDVAPQATNRFITLANNDFYNATIIHRIFPDLAIYGGQYTIDGDLKEFSYETIPVETNPSVKHIPGTISMLRTAEDQTAVGCQFLICLDNITSLDGKNTAFGIVIDGLDLVYEISNYPHDDQYGDDSGRPIGGPWDVIIDRITILTQEEYKNLYPN
jgi:peptidyl-prolyl cis-trans isomerase B (cyclophilin B)